MARLDAISVDELEEVLAQADGQKETMRLLVAIIYKRGPSVPMLAEWLDIREATIYRWFDRLEDEPLGQAVRDRPKSGRPPKLSDTERERLAEAVAQSPRAFGYDGTEWTPERTQQFIRDEFDVEYTVRHVQRLLQDF